MTTGPTDPLATSMRFQLDGNMILDGATAVGQWLPEQSRVDWSWASLGVDPGLTALAKAEAELWDHWADDEGDVAAQSAPTSDPARFSLEGWQKRYPYIRHALAEAGIQLTLRNRRVLDIGGSGKDAAYWLRDSPARIDQVEVSPRSQFLASLRLRGGQNPDTGAYIPTVYHTVPAENLPFDDSAFDFVFSRSTVHHCQRPKVFSEIDRVLKPGGVLILVEPRLSDPMHWAMRTSRRLLNRDRGTDNPLQTHEINYLENEIFARSAHRASYYFRSPMRLIGLKMDDSLSGPVSSAVAMQFAFAGQKADDNARRT